MSAARTDEAPSLGTLLGYSLSAAPTSFSFLLFMVMYLKYATESLAVSPAAIGTVFLIAKVINAVGDPLIGNWSDRTETRLGRRRPWLLVGGPLAAIFGYMAWAPPTSLAEPALVGWIALSIIGFYTAYSIFEVPHMALGAEISLDAGGRNRLFAWRQVVRVLASLVAALVGSKLIEQGRDTTQTMSLVVSIVTVAFIYLGVSALPAERAEFRGRGGQNPFRAVRDVLANPHARLLLTVIFIDSIGTGGIAVLTPFVIDHVVGRKDLLQALLGANFLATLLSVPIWLWLSRRFEKRRLMLWAMIASGFAFGSILFVGDGDWILVAVSALASGIAVSCSNTLGYTLKSEIIDCDEYRTGERKEGAYFAGWAFVQKLAAGLMIFVVGQALSWSAFDPAAESQSELVRTTMVVLMGGAPLVCYLIGAVAFARFSLSEEEHARIRRELDARAAAASASSSGTALSSVPVGA
ncbi:MFS transporter [Myxococcota bacterium]|nr:MFS transporter [Myxococcota bacterium]